MKCNNCGTGLDGSWEFCPRCGSPAGKGDVFTFKISEGFINKVFERMQKQMRNVDREMEKNFEMFDLSPFFRKAEKGRGFTIRIVSGTGMQPRVQVKTFGDIDREKIEKEAETLYQQMGKAAPEPERRETRETSRFFSKPEVTEEPKTEVKRLEDRILVDVDLPGIKNLDSVEIKDLENSVEVRAFGDNKAFFKIITKPLHIRLRDKKFDNGKLHLELR